jgi:Cobalamin-independent synthase, Catalytic domain
LLGQLGRHSGLLSRRETGKPGEVYDLTKRKEKPNAPAATRSIIPKAYEARINVLNLENGGRRVDDMSGLDAFKEFPLPANVDFWAGVIDVKSTIAETAVQVADRIEALLRVIPADRLGVTTDCGLILLQRYIAQDKLHALVEGTKLVRDYGTPSPPSDSLCGADRLVAGALAAAGTITMPVYTIICPDCAHVSKTLVLKGTRMPDEWACAKCGGRARPDPDKVPEPYPLEKEAS